MTIISTCGSTEGRGPILPVLWKDMPGLLQAYTGSHNVWLHVIHPHQRRCHLWWGFKGQCLHKATVCQQNPIHETAPWGSLSTRQHLSTHNTRTRILCIIMRSSRVPLGTWIFSQLNLWDLFGCRLRSSVSLPRLYGPFTTGEQQVPFRAFLGWHGRFNQLTLRSTTVVVIQSVFQRLCCWEWFTSHALASAHSFRFWHWHFESTCLLVGRLMDQSFKEHCFPFGIWPFNMHILFDSHYSSTQVGWCNSQINPSGINCLMLNLKIA